jgi:hypothetical protein
MGLSTSKAFTLTFTGDVMLGRLIDQLMPEHVPNQHEARRVCSFLLRGELDGLL